MAKRLTDTEKWKDDWYIQLSNDDKIVWQWLLDNCSHAGFCKKSISLLNLMCRVNYTEEEMIKRMDNRVIVVDNHWFIPKFIKFQYSTLLSGKPVIISVVKELFLMNCIRMIGESFGNHYLIINESFDNYCQTIKDKSKDKDKDNKKGGVGENKNLAVRIDENGFAFFEDGTKQKLGKSQMARLGYGDILPSEIEKGVIV